MTAPHSSALDPRAPRKPWDLTMYDSGPTALSVAMRALVETRSHFTDSMKLHPHFGRGVSLFLRVQVPEGREESLRAAIGKRGELREPPQVHL